MSLENPEDNVQEEKYIDEEIEKGQLVLDEEDLPVAIEQWVNAGFTAEKIRKLLELNLENRKHLNETGSFKERKSEEKEK